MNNLENLKDYIDENIGDIQMTEDIKKNIIRKSQKNTSHYLRYVAMIILPVFLISCFIFNDQISYAAQNILKYVPGINKLIYTDQTYGLSGSVEMAIGEKYIKVNSAYSEGNTVTLIIEGNVPISLNQIDNQIIATDENKKAAELTSSDLIEDMDNGQWSGKLKYKFNHVINKFNITYDKYQMPIIMSELPEVSFEDRNYISVEGIDIAVITNYVENKLEVNLLTQTNDSTKSVSFPLKEIYLLNDKGEKNYCISNDSQNKLYFDRKLEPGIKLVIPYILVTDENLEAKVTIGKADKLPINVQLGDNELVINNVEWTQYIERFNYKTPENNYHPIESPSQKVKLVINKNLQGTRELKLNDISADADKNELIKHTVENVDVIFDDPSEENSSKITDNDHKELVISNIKEMQDEITVTFKDPTFCVSEEVIIPLQP